MQTPVPFYAWFDPWCSELLALPVNTATPLFLQQLENEGVVLRTAVALSAHDAVRQAFPECFASEGRAIPLGRRMPARSLH